MCGDLALYLWHSPLMGDFALLPEAPTINASSYSLFDPEPVFYSSTCGGVDSLDLNVYYSSDRGDYQTTTKTLAELNEGGGNYVGPVEPSAGYLLESPSPQLTPVELTYSDNLHTAITAPWVGNDVNELFGVDESNPFRSSSTILGYAKAGTCKNCNVMLSETFPSAGGADCPSKCDAGRKSANVIYRVGKEDDMNSSEGGKNFLASMKLAGDVVKSFDDSVDPESGTSVHLSFEHLCCHTDDELDTIKGGEGLHTSARRCIYARGLTTFLPSSLLQCSNPWSGSRRT